MAHMTRLSAIQSSHMTFIKPVLDHVWACKLDFRSRNSYLQLYLGGGTFAFLARMLPPHPPPPLSLPVQLTRFKFYWGERLCSYCTKHIHTGCCPSLVSRPHTTPIIHSVLFIVHAMNVVWAHTHTQSSNLPPADNLLNESLLIDIAQNNVNLHLVFMLVSSCAVTKKFQTLPFVEIITVFKTGHTIQATPH